MPRISIRYPVDVHDRLLVNKLETRETLNAFVVQATEEKLDRDGVPRDVKIRRRRPARAS